MSNKQPEQVEEKEILVCPGHSETRLVHFRSSYDGSYCYSELEEGYNNLHDLKVANAWDDDFDNWFNEKQLASHKEER